MYPPPPRTKSKTGTEHNLIVPDICFIFFFFQEFNFSITTTWDGDPVGHNPIEFKVSTVNETSVKVDVSGPLFNDPGPPTAPPGSPCPELWEYEGKLLTYEARTTSSVTMRKTLHS